MNKIFENNINSLKDDSLKELIKNYEYKTPPLLLNNNGYNIEYNGILIHDKNNPYNEAVSIFRNAQNNENSIQIIYGIGLGYLLQIAAKESKGTVLIYEPNLDILYNTLSLVDFSNEFIKDNIFLFNDFEKLMSFLTDITVKETTVDILSLKSYRDMYREVFDEHTKKLELNFGSVILDYGFKNKKVYGVTYNLLKNIPQLLQETPINKYEGLYEGKTAIIVSAGPTLVEHILSLKKYQDNAIIFAVGPAARTLIKNDIKIDYLCIVEAYNCTKQVEGLDLSNITLISEPYSSPAVHNLKVKNKLLHISNNMPPGEYFGNILKINTDKYFTRGTVSFMALNTAVNMGFNKIILVGQDLAYIDGQCYGKDTAYDNLICKFNPTKNKYEIMAKDIQEYADSLSASQDKDIRLKVANKRLRILNAGLYSVKSVDGNMIPTEAGYASFIQHFTSYAKELNHIQLINSSLKGAQIDGFKNISLEDAMKDSSPIEKPELDVSYTYDNKEALVNNLLSVIKTLEEYDKTADNCGKIASRLLTEFRRNRTVDKEKLLKIREMIKCYTLMNEDTPTNFFFKLITIAEENILSDYLKTVTEYNEINTPQVVKYLQEYYSSIKERISKINAVLAVSINEVNK